MSSDHNPLGVGLHDLASPWTDRDYVIILEEKGSNANQVQEFSFMTRPKWLMAARIGTG